MKKLFSRFFTKNIKEDTKETKPEGENLVESTEFKSENQPQTEKIPQQETISMTGEEPKNDAKKDKKSKKVWSKKKKIIVSCTLCILLLAIACVGIFLITLHNNPMSAFKKVAQQVTTAPSEAASPSDTQPDDTPTASSEPDPYDEIKSKANMDLLKDIVNIMLIGVDHGDEREDEDWTGKRAFHADVMIVLAINTKTSEVNMISLPRDTWAEIPEVKGIYKINASLDCGGGWPKPEGFKKVCDTASWMLGGIPVEYYYAVDMGAVKQLVDAIGGVDYNIDLDFKINKRKYMPGLQHMDGQAVLDYLRVRKYLDASEEGDLHRIERQKKMLAAIFDKLRKTDLLAQLPSLLESFKGNLITNTDFTQTAALALFMKNIDSASIKMNAMDGTYDTLFFDLRYVFTNQKKRVELIKQIYGVDVPQEKKYTHGVAVSKWANMQKSVILRKASDVLSKAKTKLDEDAKLQEYVPPADGSGPSTPPGGYKKYGSAVWDLYNKTNNEYNSLDSKSGETLLAANTQIMGDILSLCGKLGISKPSFGVNADNYNEIDVDPR